MNLRAKNFEMTTSKNVMVLSQYSTGRGTPLASLWFSSESCCRYGVILEFVSTKHMSSLFRILRTSRVLFDETGTLRYRLGPLLYWFALFLNKQVSIYWHETAWGIDRARSIRRRWNVLEWFKAFTVRHAMVNPRVFHMHVCQFGVEQLQYRYGIDSGRICLLNACSDTENLLQYVIPSPIDRDLHVCAGKVGERKGVDYFLEVAAKVSKQRPYSTFLWIGSFGEGEYSETSLVRLLQDRELDRNVVFTGYIEQPLPLYYHAATFLLLSRDEPFPKFLQEGLALGKPCIGFNVGGVPDIVRDNGLVVSLGDVNKVASYITEMDRTKYDSEAQRARREYYTQCLTPERFARDFLETLRTWDDFERQHRAA